MSKEQKVGLPIKDFFRRPIDFLRGIPPRQRLSRRQRRETGRARQQSLQEWQEGRRRLLKTGGLVLAGVAAGGVGVLARAVYEAPKEEPFTGEIGETKAYLQRWGKEVGEDPEKLKQYLPRITDLTIAFFSKQMGYDEKASKNFKKRFVLLGQEEYEEELSQPKPLPDLNPRTAPAFTDPVEGMVYINSDLGKNTKRIFKSENTLAEVAFFLILHEMFHLSSKLLRYNPPVIFIGIDKPINYEKGLLALSKDDTLSTPQKEAYYPYRHALEETVVHYATIQKASLLGIKVEGMRYDRWVKKYRDLVLVPYYGGRDDELLRYQQNTDADGFFRSIGERLGAKTPQEQFMLGNNFIVNLLQ